MPVYRYHFHVHMNQKYNKDDDKSKVETNNNLEYFDVETELLKLTSIACVMCTWKSKTRQQDSITTKRQSTANEKSYLFLCSNVKGSRKFLWLLLILSRVV